MIKLYGHPMSTCSRKVLMTLAETETPYELTTIDFSKGEHKGEAYLARQPFGQLPALEDDGFRMFESRAMMRYIAEKAKSPLVPSDLKARATMEQWISVESANLTPHAMKYVYKHIFQRPVADDAMTAATEALHKWAGVMNASLAKQPFAAGESMTLADIGCMPYLGYTMNTPAKAIYEQYPNVMTWWGRLAERPTWKKIAG